MSKLKKFSRTLPSGLGITESGRLQVPYVCSFNDSGLNGYGQPMGKIGDKIADVSHTGRITKKNIGEIVDIGVLNVHGLDGRYVIMKHLDGNIQDGEWLRGAYVLNKNEYEDAIQYLTKEK